MRLLVIGMLSSQILLGRSFYVCKAQGKVEDWPTSSNTHGVYTKYYEEADNNREEAESLALRTCRLYADYGCQSLGCREYYEPGH